MKRILNILAFSALVIFNSAFASDTVDLQTDTTTKSAHSNLSNKKNLWSVDLFAGSQSSDTLGWNGSRYDTDKGEMFGVGISKQVQPRMYLGFELSRTKAKYRVNDAYISGTTGMLTAEYDFFQSGRFSAYGGLGIGLTEPSFQQTNEKKYKETSILSGQAKLGARYVVTARSKVFIEARYLDTSEHFSIAGAGATPSPSNATAEYNAKGIVLGFSYSF